MSKTMVLILLFALLLPFVASLPSLLFIKACKNTNIKDPNNYCIRNK
jgi:hypothetical protein